MKSTNKFVKGILGVMLTALFLVACKHQTAPAADPREANRKLDAPTISYVKHIDDTSRNAVFVFTKDYPEFGKLNNRVIVLKPLNLDLSLKTEEYVQKEYMGPVYILLPAYYIGIRASVMMKCFPAYKGFKLKEVSENYALYYASQKR